MGLCSSGHAGRDFPSGVFPQGAQGARARDGEQSSEGPRSQPGFPSGLRGQFLEACHAQRTSQRAVVSHKDQHFQRKEIKRQRGLKKNHLNQELCASQCMKVKVAKSHPTHSDPMNCSPLGSSVPGMFSGKNTGMGCHSLFQGIFLTQGSNPSLLHGRRILYHLSHLLFIYTNESRQRPMEVVCLADPHSLLHG